MTLTSGPVVHLAQASSSNLLGVGYQTSRRSNNLTGTNTKGLLNMPGQNNCFLNSAVQVLWHLDTFRQSFQQLSNHSCIEECCIFCALKELFTQFQYSQDSALPPDALRHALAKTFCDQKRFQLGFMDDAAECFENILWRIHVHITNQESGDKCADPRCIPHQKFAMTIIEQPVCCNCSTTFEPLPFTQMVHYVTTSALCYKSMELNNNDFDVRASFGQLLKLAADVGEVRKCSSGCGSKIHVKKMIMNRPEIVSIGLVWDSDSPSLEHITDVFQNIGMFLCLRDMFHNLYDDAWAKDTYHELVGIVTYYGKHYSTFFFHSKLRVWIYFDDAVVREIGPSWELVVKKCEKGRFQPLLLLYANSNGSLYPSSAFHGTMLQHELPEADPLKSLGHLSSAKKCVFTNQFTETREMPQCNTNLPRYPAFPKTEEPVYSNISVAVSKTKMKSEKNLTNHIYSNLQMDNFCVQNVFPASKNTNRLNRNNDAYMQSNQSVKQNPSFAENQDFYYKARDESEYAKDSDSAFTDDQECCDTYISRKTVENILNFQKLHKHNSLNQPYIGGASNRNSSSSLESFDNVHSTKLCSALGLESKHLLNNHNSDTCSSDRNSTSSNRSAENPFLAIVSSKRLLFGPSSCQPTTTAKGKMNDYSGSNGSDHGYDSYSASSSDSYMSINNSPKKLEPRLTQIPEDLGHQDSSNDFDKILRIVTEEGPPDCDKLCAEADLLLTKSHEKEKLGDLVMAALLADAAAARARAAMDAPYNNSHSLVSAKMKHSTCVMRSSCLYRRLKDGEIDERRKAKGHHSRQSSRDSTHSRHSRQSSKDNTHNKQTSSSQSAEDNKSIEIYGTLPKKGSRKKAQSSSLPKKAKDDQVCSDFSDKQHKPTNYFNPSCDNLKSLQTTDSKERFNTVSEKSVKKVSDTAPTKLHIKKSAGIASSGVVTDDHSTSLKKGNRKQHVEQQPDSVVFHKEKQDSNCCSDVDRSSKGIPSSPDKKQHRIKKKLIGSFMRRKNRSLPDLRADDMLSDDFESPMSDATTHKSTTLTLSNEKLDKLDGNVDVSRGFHQPHHAFIKKNGTQRSLLTKVCPPVINSSAISNQLPNNTVHPLPSVPKKSVSSVSSKSSDVNFEGLSKIPVMCAIPKIQSLSPSKISDPEVPVPQTSVQKKPSSIPIPACQTLPQVSETSVKKQALEMVSPSTPLVSSKREDTSVPHNPFLAEIQAKRKQIIEKKNMGNKLAKNTTTLQSPISLPQPPKVASGNGGGITGQKQTQNKPNKLFDPAPKAEKIRDSSRLKKDLSSKVESNNEVFQEHSENLETIKANQNSAVLKNEKSKSTSVKDLALKFEKVLPKDFSISKPHVLPSREQSVNNGRTASNYSDQSENKTEKPTVPVDSLRKVLPDSTDSEGQSNSFNEENQFKNQNAQDDTRTPEPAAVTKEQQNSNFCRPQQPPDYQTAMQRLERMRTGLPGVVKDNVPDCGQQADREPVLKQNKIPMASDTKKKSSGPKKTVTFSDEVVLVACAEIEETEFLNNPLLERVYQKHIEAGGSEVPQLRHVGSHQVQKNEYQRQTATDADTHSSSSDDVVPCHLCHNKYVSSLSVYCTDCAFYMSRYQH